MPQLKTSPHVVRGKPTKTVAVNRNKFSRLLAVLEGGPHRAPLQRG